MNKAFDIFVQETSVTPPWNAAPYGLNSWKRNPWLDDPLTPQRTHSTTTNLVETLGPYITFVVPQSHPKPPKHTQYAPDNTPEPPIEHPHAHVPP
jgi:hypothetical protein